MNIHRMTTRALCLASLAGFGVTPIPAWGQSLLSRPGSVATVFANPVNAVPGGSMRLTADYQSRQMWHDLAFASGAIALVGILQDDSTLTIIGTVGVLFCLVQSEQGGRFHFSPEGFDFAGSRGFSAGITPFGMTDLRQGPRPAAFLQLSFRF